MPRAHRPRTGALVRDLGTVLVAVALLSVPRVLADSGLPGGSATEAPDVSATATAPPDAVPSGPVRPVDDEPLVASRDPFTQLVVPEPPETEGAPAGEEGTADAPDSSEQAPADMAPVELPEPEEQPAPGEGEPAPGEEQPPSPEDGEAPQGAAPGEEGEARPDGGGVSSSDEQSSSSGQVRSSQPPPPAAAGPESLRLERIAVDETGVARAHLTVAGERYTPAEGETFGDGYHLAEIDAPCVRVIHGDTRERLCEDERVFAK